MSIDEKIIDAKAQLRATKSEYRKRDLTKYLHRLEKEKKREASR